METGFTLDKESNTMALICSEVVVVLAFDSRELLIQWQVKVRANLVEGKENLYITFELNFNQQIDKNLRNCIFYILIKWIAEFTLYEISFKLFQLWNWLKILDVHMCNLAPFQIIYFIIRSRFHVCCNHCSFRRYRGLIILIIRDENVLYRSHLCPDFYLYSGRASVVNYNFVV